MITINFKKIHLLFVLFFILSILYAVNIFSMNKVSAVLIEKTQTHGAVSAVVLIDETCRECFDGNQYLKIMNRVNIVVGKFTVYDISSGKGADLVSKYKIKKIPALILSSDAKNFPNFLASWKEVGTEESDGFFVLRQVQKVSEGFKEI